MLLLVCAAQAWLMWRFIHSQLRHWREYWNEQSAKRRVPPAPRLPARLIKRESGECQGPAGRQGQILCGVGGKEPGPRSLCALPRPALQLCAWTLSAGPGAPWILPGPDWHVCGVGQGWAVGGEPFWQR